MIEVEIKAKISDPEGLRETLTNHDATYLISLHHEDTYFNMPKKLRDFRKTDEALRIRRSLQFKKDNPKRKEEKYFITYKGAKLDSSTKTRREMETSVKDGQVLREILKILGFQEVYTIKKERDLYLFEQEGKEIEVLIDYLPLLGNYFIEAELIVESEKDIEDARKILFAFLKKLNISKEKSIRKSYLELIIDKINLDE